MFNRPRRCARVDLSHVLVTPGNSGGESEAIIGEWLSARASRQDLLMATKVGAEVFGGRGLSPARIGSSVEGALKRLRTDYIDLYFARLRRSRDAAGRDARSVRRHQPAPPASAEVVSTRAMAHFNA